MSSFNYDLVVYFCFEVAVFDTFVSCYASFVHVNVEEAHAAVVATVAAVTSETGSAGVAHPEGGLLRFIAR